ncbi:hypothetical protein V6N13_059484 [Hibiscus sabdariffa]|uniref:Uncharacterized protein n=1 Tax=Hibiscus sabdariffa TaxID=183260 RepID=A0ABR2GE32_9ROSI
MDFSITVMSSVVCLSDGRSFLSLYRRSRLGWPDPFHRVAFAVGIWNDEQGQLHFFGIMFVLVSFFVYRILLEVFLHGLDRDWYGVWYLFPWWFRAGTVVVLFVGRQRWVCSVQIDGQFMPG